MKHFILSGIFVFLMSTSFAQLEMPDFDDLPVRLTRSFGISMDIGWNSLVGMGPTIQYFVSPHVGIDGGIGLSSTGIKLGARGRYLFLEKTFTPFLGAGFNYGFGGGDENNTIKHVDQGNTIYYYVLPSPFLQITVGGDLLVYNGFFLLFDLGYSILLNGENTVIVSGTPTSTQKKAMDIALGSGIVFEVGIGIIFKNNRKY